MSLDNVVSLNISRSAAAVSRQGFGTALVLGTETLSGWGSDRIREYEAAADLLEDGFSSSDLSYKAALRLFGQEVKPASIKVGRRLTAVAQVETLTPVTTSQQVQHYIVTINDTEFDFTSDSSPTAAEVVTGLTALINAGDEPVTASGSTTLILTADEAGISFTVTPSANLTQVHTTANVGVATDLADIKEIDNDWYGLVITSRDPDVILEAAAWIEAERKIMVACSSEAGVLVAATTTDIASRLKALSYARTLYFYSGAQASMPDAALLGTLLPRTPGAWTAKFKTLSGVAVDDLTATQRSAALAKNALVYTTVGGLGMTEEGKVADGEFLDVIVGVDWIHANMQADIFQALMDNAKLPYTNAGAGVIEQIIQNRLRLAVVAQILAEDPAPAVTVPLVADQDPADKAARTLGGITFTATLAGAIHAVEINGNVSV